MFGNLVAFPFCIFFGYTTVFWKKVSLLIELLLGILLKIQLKAIPFPETL